MSRQQQGHPQAFPQLIQQAQNVADSLRVQTGCRLVQNHHFRFHDQHTGNCHPFFLPIGQRMGRFLPQRTDPGPGHGLLYPSAHLLRRKAQIHRAE